RERGARRLERLERRFVAAELPLGLRDAEQAHAILGVLGEELPEACNRVLPTALLECKVRRMRKRRGLVLLCRRTDRRAEQAKKERAARERERSGGNRHRHPRRARMVRRGVGLRKAWRIGDRPVRRTRAPPHGVRPRRIDYARSAKLAQYRHGEVAERSNAAVLKTVGQ